MAAANVPSRARAHARPPQPPPPSPVTYVRMSLQINSLRGAHLSPPPVKYLFRWVRGGKEVKSTAAHSIDLETNAFSGKMALYARVKRAGLVFVTDEPAEPLLTELVLVADDPTEGEPAPVANAQFDIGKFLHQIVQASSKTMTTEILFTAAITVGVNLTIKALGENHLTPIEEPVNREDDNVAAQELEKLRTEIRGKEGKLDAIAASTAKLEKLVKETTKVAENAVPAGELAALQVKIATLEEQNKVLENERIEVERKVSAHVVHAAKIKATYNQLATWYNNVAKENVELMKRCSSTNVASAASKALPAGVDTTHDEDIKNLEKERNQLQELLERERNDKKNMYSQNSELLESKARTLADLGQQWEAAKITLSDAQNALQEQTAVATSLQETVDKLLSEATERDSQLQDRSDALKTTTEKVKELEAMHVNLSVANATAEEETKSTLQKQLENFKVEHEEELARRLKEAEMAYDVSIEEKLAALRLEHKREVESLQKETADDLSRKSDEELVRLRNEMEDSLRAKSEEADKSVATLKDAAISLEAKLNSVEAEKADLENRVDDLVCKMEEKQVENSQAMMEADERHRSDLDVLRSAKEDVEKDLATEKERVSVSEKEAMAAQEAIEKSRAIVEEELKEAREELISLRKANDALHVSPRDISGSQNDSLDTVHALTIEINQLKALIKTETDNGNELTRLLANANSDNDEAREMVTRMRAERDEAVQDFNKSKDIVPNPNVNINAVQQGAFAASREGDAGNLLEERDKAIRELFRVRKAMNKEIKRLKKENEGLTASLQQVSEQTNVQNRDVSSVSPENHEPAVSSFKKLQDALSTHGHEHASNASRSASSSTTHDDITSDVLNTLASLRTELETLKSTNRELEETSKESVGRLSKEMEMLSQERDELLQEIDEMRKDLDVSSLQLQEKEVELSSISASANVSAREREEFCRKWEDALHERDMEKEKSIAFNSQLGTLKHSLRIAESVAPSLESELQKTQRQLAEAKRSLSLLEVRHDELSRKAEERESYLENEIAKLDMLAQERARLESDLASRDHEVEEIQISVQKLKSRNASLTAKMAGERSLRETSQRNLIEANERIEQLEEDLRNLRSKDLKNVAIQEQLQGNIEQADMALTAAKERLDIAESRLAEQNAELVEARDKLQQAHSSRDFLQKEASAVGGKSQELATLRAEWNQSQADLQKALQDLEVESQRNSARAEKEERRILEIESEKDSLMSTHAALQSMHDTTTGELQMLKESYSKLESLVESIEENSKNLNSTISEKDTESESLKAEISELKLAEEQTKANYERLLREVEQSKVEFSKVKEEMALLREDKQSDCGKIGTLEQELSDLQNCLAHMQEASEEAAASASSNAEKETRKVAEMRKEVGVAKSMADELQDEVDRLRESNTDLLQQVETLTESVDGRDTEVLGDLINTRMELAYAQEETIRLRNRLKKLSQSSKGNSSFDH